MSRPSIVFALAVSFAFGAAGQQRPAGTPAAAGRTPAIDERTSGMQKLDGYFPLYWDERTGSLWLEIPRFDADFLYATGLAAGLGANAAERRSVEDSFARSVLWGFVAIGLSEARKAGAKISRKGKKSP